jgi:cell division GTPase FtsZ
MFDYIIGLGQGGGRLAKAFEDGFSVPAMYMNLAGIDFAHMPISKRNRLVIEEGGTGRDPKFGEKKVREHFDRVEKALTQSRFDQAKYVLVTVGGGGGAGTGFMFPVIDYLIKAGKQVFVVFTLPENREGIPTKPNALYALDRLIDRYINKNRVSVLLVENEYCVKRYGSDGSDYWGSVNRAIVNALKRFWLITKLEEFSEFIDISAGYKALDTNDLRRILFATNGYIDIRQLNFDSRINESEGLSRMIRESSLLFGSLDSKSTKQYVISIAIPMAWKGESWAAEFVEEIFSSISKATRHTPAVIRTSYYNSKITSIQVNILMSGMSRSKGLG